MDWLDLFAVQGTLKESSPTPQFKSINSLERSFLYSPTLNLLKVTLSHFWDKSENFLINSTLPVVDLKFSFSLPDIGSQAPGEVLGRKSRETEEFHFAKNNQTNRLYARQHSRASARGTAVLQRQELAHYPRHEPGPRSGM